MYHASRPLFVVLFSLVLLSLASLAGCDEPAPLPPAVTDTNNAAVDTVDVPATATPSAGKTASTPGFADVVAKASPAVVNIATTRTVVRQGEGPPGLLDDPFFRRFFGEEFFERFQAPREQTQRHLGSGVIVDDRGHIVTNSHVVKDSDEILVTLDDGREFEGRVIGADSASDIAVVQIDGESLPVLPWGNSDALLVGEYVLAIGNPFGLKQTVTMGIVSAVGRANVGIADYEDFIQTDAAINPGNSGGALINARGELIGINTAIFSRTGGHMGIGFAVPSDMARSVMLSLIEHGEVVRGWLGVSIQGMTGALAESFGLDDPRGVLIADVAPRSPADRGGLKAGDVIVSYAGEPVLSPGDLRNRVAETGVGSTVDLRIVRDNEPRTMEVRIGERPQPEETEARAEAPGAGETPLAGVAVQGLTPELAQRHGYADARGVLVRQVAPGSAAAMAGMQPGDIIRRIHRKTIDTLDDYADAVADLEGKRSALVLIARGQTQLFVVIGER